MARRPVIGVMGGHEADETIAALAEELGRSIAAEGWILLNGARNQGVMAATARGAGSAGGFSIGIHPDLPGSTDVAPDLDVVVFTGVGFARNAINVLSSDVIIALPGSAGTLSEVAYGRTYGKPTILLGFDDKNWFGTSVVRVETVTAAIDAARGALSAQA